MTKIRASRLTYKAWLQQEFVRRCRMNPNYSIRAFANFLKTDSSSLTQILRGTRNASVKMIERFADLLEASPEIRLVIVADAKKKQRRKFALPPQSEPESYLQLQEDIFNMMADWYHYAILELSKIPGFDPSPRWIAVKLGLSTTEARIAIERLQRLSLLVKENGKLKASTDLVTNAGGLPTSEAMRSLQRQVLQKALRSIEETPPERKDITSMTMAIDERKLPEARTMIKEFRRRLCDFVEDGVPSAVFNLGIQLYPLTETSEEKNELS